MIKKIFWIFFAVIGMVMFVHVGGAYAETSDAVSTGNVGDAIDSIEMSGSIVQLESISFSTTDINLKIGESIDAKTAIIYSPIDTMDNPPLVWTSNDANIAQVDGTGNIIGVSPGTAVINASAGSIATSVIVNVTSLADIPVGNTSATDSTLLPTTIASPADPVTETAPTDTTTNTPPADPVTETAPTDTTTNTPPADSVTETTPTDTTTNTPPADLVTETAPTDTTTNTPPADPVTETAPIDSITGTLPVDTATEMPPADNIPDTSIVDSAAEVLPEENPLQVQTDTDSLVLDAQNPDSLSAAVILESETNAQLLFVFDDSRKTDITIAAPVLAASGFSGTAYVMTDPFWATVGFMTNADLETLYSDYGWDLGNHSLNHLDITDLNDQENMVTLVQEYLINQENLIANGWTRGAYHVAYANDVYNEELVQLLMQMGVLTARTFGTDTLMPTPIQDYYRLSIVDILSGLTAVKSQIDEAIRTNATIMLVTHGIADTAFGDKVSLADFQTIVNYVSQYAGLGQLEVKTISQWYTDMTALDPTVPLQAITLDTTNFELLKGASKTLLVSYSPTDTTDDLRVTWQSSNESVARVDASGTVFAVGEGTATIKARVGNLTASSQLTVTSLPESTSKAQILFVFDDSRKTDITIAAPVLAASGFSGTAYVMTDPFWATVGFMTNADLETLYSDYGWDLGNHSLNHLDITDLNDQENMVTLVQEYLINQENLIANGWTRGAYHVAYANDVYNEELVQLLMQMGVLTARTFGTDTLMPTPIQDYYRLSIVDILSGLAAVKSQIDEAIRTNATIMLVTHGIADTAFGDKVSLADFQTIVNYVSQYAGLGQLEVKTISQWYADMTALDASVPLEAITLDTTNFELTEGTSKTLVVSYSPTDTTDDLKVTWQSSNENVAYVDASGTVFAVGEGVAIITATVGKNTAQSYVTVTLPYRAPSASLLFTFDDGRTSTLTLGASILSDYGFVGTAYVMSDPYFSSTGRFLNVSELDILYNYYGWDIGNHTESHLVLPSVLSSSDITYFTQQYLNTQNWLLANGWTRAAYHAAYPNGYYNEQLINILKSIGVDSARLYGANGLVPLPVNDFYRLSMVDLVSGVSVVKSYIDAAVSTGSTIILTGHDIGTSASDSISISAFQEICAYVLGYVDKDLLNVTTISDWFNSQL